MPSRWVTGVPFSTGHESPHHNRRKNDYSDQIRPAASFLELFLIYHGSALARLILRRHSRMLKQDYEN